MQPAPRAQAANTAGTAAKLRSGSVKAGSPRCVPPASPGDRTHEGNHVPTNRPIAQTWGENESPHRSQGGDGLCERARGDGQQFRQKPRKFAKKKQLASWRNTSQKQGHGEAALRLRHRVTGADAEPDARGEAARGEAVPAAGGWGTGKTNTAHPTGTAKPQDQDGRA